MATIEGLGQFLKEEVANLEDDAQILSDLNVMFRDLKGKKNKDECSRCIVFFCIGRILGKTEAYEVRTRLEGLESA